MPDAPTPPDADRDAPVTPDRRASERDAELHRFQKSRRSDRTEALAELSNGHRKVLRDANRDVRALVREALVEIAPPGDPTPGPRDPALAPLEAKLGRILATRHSSVLGGPETRSILHQIADLEGALVNDAQRVGREIRESNRDGLLDVLRGSLAGRGGAAQGAPASRRPGEAPARPSTDPAVLEEQLEDRFAELGFLALSQGALDDLNDPSVTAIADELRAARPRTGGRPSTPSAQPSTAALTAAPPALDPETLRVFKHRVTRVRDALILLDEELTARLEQAREAEQSFLDRILAAEASLEEARQRSFDREESLRAGRLEEIQRHEESEKSRRATLALRDQIEREIHERRLREETAIRKREEATRKRLDLEMRRKLRITIAIAVLGVMGLALGAFQLAGGFTLIREVATGQRAIEFDDSGLRTIDLTADEE